MLLKNTMQSYQPEDEEAMRHFYHTQNEKDRRRYAGLEALKLGHGGQNYMACVLKCSRRLIRKGAQEISNLSAKEVYEHIREPKRIRKPGGGRQSYQIKYPEINEKFLEVMRDHTAGNPMDEKIVWTDLKPNQIAKLLTDEHGISVSKTTVKK